MSLVSDIQFQPESIYKFTLRVADYQVLYLSEQGTNNTTTH